jgi:hypothetical protein
MRVALVPQTLECVRAINFAENNYRGHISASGNHASSNSRTAALNVSGISCKTRTSLYPGRII